jgi:thiol-disulfide isomerase/thioredoxin
MKGMRSQRLPAASLMLAVGLALAPPAGAANVPRQIADISMVVSNGQRVRFAQNSGKPRVIVLVSTTCAHCETMIGTLNKLHETYSKRGVEFLGAAVNADAVYQLYTFVAKTRAAFPVGTLNEQDTRRLADFGPQDRPFVPILLLVDRGNTVRHQLFGDDQRIKENDANGIRALIETLLKR